MKSFLSPLFMCGLLLLSPSMAQASTINIATSPSGTLPITQGASWSNGTSTAGVTQYVTQVFNNDDTYLNPGQAIVFTYTVKSDALSATVNNYKSIWQSTLVYGYNTADDPALTLNSGETGTQTRYSQDGLAQAIIKVDSAQHGTITFINAGTLLAHVTAHFSSTLDSLAFENLLISYKSMSAAEAMAAVPLPASLLLFGTALTALVARSRKKSQA